MTDTTTVDATPDDDDAPRAASRASGSGADGTAEDTPLKTRVLLPLLVPLLVDRDRRGAGAQHLAACSSPATRTPRS